MHKKITGFSPSTSTGGGTSDARFLKDFTNVIEFGLVNSTAMISGNYIVVAAQSPKNTCSLDVYSLMGFTKAYNKMKEICTEDD